MARTKQGARKVVSQLNNRTWGSTPATGGQDSSSRQQHDKVGKADEQSAEEQRMPETVAEALLQALRVAPPPGDFATGGQLDFVLPGLEVLDSSSGSFEPVGLPLSAAAAAALASKLELVPVGGSNAAASDAEASQALQLDAARFRLNNPRWQEVVDTAIDECCNELGVGDVDVDAQPHKLLLFADGSRPSVPYDAAQAEGGWGTLVVHLPTAYEGGQLVVSHGGRSKTFDFSAHSAYSVHYAAFYADCNHEVRPVTRGHHVALVYSLTCSGQRPEPADHSAAVAAVRAVVQRWEEERQADASTAPEKLVYLLELRYSQDGLHAGLADLTGADRRRGQVLAALQEEGLLDVHIALARRVDWGCDIDLYDTVQHFVGLDGRPAPHWGTVDLDTLKELCQCDGLNDLWPDSESEQEDSDCSEEEGGDCSDDGGGDYNDEASYRRRVSISALVVWPKSRRWDMLGKGGLKPAAQGLLDAAQQGSVPAADQREWAAALLRALPQTDKADAVAAVLAAVAELHDAQLAEQCLAVLSTAHSQRQRFGGRQSAAAAACITAEHAPALARLCRLCGWSAPCLSAVEVLLKRLATGGVCSLPSCIALLQELHAAATAPEGIAHATAAVASVAAPAAVPDPAEAAAPQAAAAAAPAAAAGAAAGGAAPATALSQPAGGDSCGQAAVAALLKSSLVHLSSRLAVVQRADSGGYERARQAEAAAGMVQLLSLVQEWSDEAAIEKFLLTGFARHFIAAGPAADGSGGDCVEGQGPMLAVLLAACQRFGWGSSRTAAILTAAASGCAPSTGGYGDFLELAKGVQAAAGHAAAALVPQLTAAFLKALPPAQPSVYAYPETTELDLRAQDLLDWMAEQGSQEQFGTLFEHAVTCKLGLQAAVDVALRMGPAKGWWAELQPGLVAAFGKAHSEADMPAVLEQLRRVRQASGVDSGAAAASAAAGDGGAPASADAVQRYMQLAAAVVGTLEPSQPVRYSMPSTPSAAADFVRDLLLAAYVPGCSESDQLFARAAAHVCRSPQRYPVDTVLLPALEGMAQQLQLGSLAAAVQAVPGLRAVVQHAVGTLPQPPAPPEDWSRPAAAHWIICVKRNCVDCPAVRSFLEDARESERRFEMDRKRLGHFASVIGSALSSMRRRNGNRACPGFTWKEDGTAVVCSKRGAYEAELAEFNRKHAPWRQLQAVLDGEGAPPSGGGDGPGAVQQQQQPQQQQDSGDASNPADGGPPAKKQRL